MSQNGFNTKIILEKIAGFTENIFTIPALYELSRTSLNFIWENYHPVYISFILFDGKTHEPVIDDLLGYPFKRQSKPSISYCQDIVKSIDLGGEILASPNLDSSNFLVLFDADQSGLCEIRIPFFIDQRYIGIISLGKRQNGMDYNVEMIDSLRIITNAVAIVCHHLDLESKIKKITNPVSKTEIEKFNPLIMVKGKDDYSEIMGESPAIRQIQEMISVIAVEDVSILITGESGTGKELVAREIHNKSRRKERPLVAMNCAALPENLVESELFGHEKGAFTGAVALKHGKFDFAHQSTLFLDEIGDMNLSVQAKLLRVLQDGQFQRVGGNKSIYSDVRLITATNKNLKNEIESGYFRQDLFYRINVVQIEMPPLRTRGEDVIMLANYFLNEFNTRYKKAIRGFEPDVLKWMLSFNFPGNVRELKNIIERSVIMNRSDLITIDMMPVSPSRRQEPVVSHSSLDEIEKLHIISVMKQVDCNKSAASRMLGIARKTLREKIQKYNIQF